MSLRGNWVRLFVCFCRLRGVRVADFLITDIYCGYVREGSNKLSSMNYWTSPSSGSVGSIESITLIEELIEWSIEGWESEGQKVH